MQGNPFSSLNEAGRPGRGAGDISRADGCLSWLPPDPACPQPSPSRQPRKSWLGLPGQRRPGNLTLCARLIFRNVSSQRLASVPLRLWAGGAVTCAAFERADSEWATVRFEYKHTPFMPWGWHLASCTPGPWVRASAGSRMGNGEREERCHKALTGQKGGGGGAPRPYPPPLRPSLFSAFLLVPRALPVSEQGACSPTGEPSRVPSWTFLFALGVPRAVAELSWGQAEWDGREAGYGATCRRVLLHFPV